MTGPLKVMIVDDTITYRSILSEVVKNIPGTEVVNTASNGKVALDKLAMVPADLVLLDIEMPEMDGLETLKVLRRRYPNTGVIMVSGMNRSSADVTMRALEEGAMDFIPKPDGDSLVANKAQLQEKLAPLFKLYASRHGRLAPEVGQPRPAAPSPVLRPKPVSSDTSSVPVSGRPPRVGSYGLVVIGISTGGPNALSEVIPQLPQHLGVPILIVQHMPPVFTASLASSLNRKSKINVKEAEAGEAMMADTVYIAPGGFHMVLEKGRMGNYVLNLNEEAPENSCRPAVDVLFRSVSKCFDKPVLALIMTGMGRDGAEGVRLLKARECLCISQSEQSCVVYGMPRSVDELKLSDEQVELSQIASRVTLLVTGKPMEALR